MSARIECAEARDLDFAEVHPAAAQSLRALGGTPSVLAVPHAQHLMKSSVEHASTPIAA